MFLKEISIMLLIICILGFVIGNVLGLGLASYLMFAISSLIPGLTILILISISLIKDLKNY